MPSARCSMLDRAEAGQESPQADREIESRPVTFRGAGFTPKAGRYSGWMALVLVIGFWQLAGSAGWVNPLFLPTPRARLESPIEKPTITPATVPRIHPVPIRMIETDRWCQSAPLTASL